jgi:GAF domain-containing protein
VLDLAEALAELGHLMLAIPSVEAMLGDVARLSAGVIRPPAACGITLQRDHQPFTAAATDPLAAHADELQYGEDQGPCLQSLRSGQVVSVPDLTTEHRWGTYPARALSYGVRSSLSLPLTVDGDTRGALNLHATVPGAFGDAERQRAELFAAQASAALTVVVRQTRQLELSAQLREALASRSVIDQAIGILMAQQHCDAELAFTLLRGASQHQNRKLRDVATEIVVAVGGGAPRPSPFND